MSVVTLTEGQFNGEDLVYLVNFFNAKANRANFQDLLYASQL